jgi:hypothetical protein
MSCNLGLDAKIYYEASLAAGTLATAVWTEIDLARDVNTSASANETETSDRRSNFVTTCPSLITLETSFTATYENSDSQLDDIRDAFLNRTPLLVAVVDGDITVTGTEGFVYWAHVFTNDFNQPLTEQATVEITFKPTSPPSTDATTNPQWYTVV